MTEIYAALWVIGDSIDPDAVVAHVPLVPRSIRRRGDLTPTGRPHQPCVWFTTDDRLRLTIGDALDDLFADLAPSWDYLRGLRDSCELAIECYVKLHDENDAPGLGFEPRHVAKAAELGASLGIDYQDFRV